MSSLNPKGNPSVDPDSNDQCRASPRKFDEASAKTPLPRFSHCELKSAAFAVLPGGFLHFEKSESDEGHSRESRIIYQRHCCEIFMPANRIFVDLGIYIYCHAGVRYVPRRLTPIFANGWKFSSSSPSRNCHGDSDLRTDVNWKLNGGLINRASTRRAVRDWQ